MITDDDARDLLGAYALDAVDEVERRAVERLLEHDPDAAHELAGLQATAALLGSAVASRPPAGLRSDVLAAIARTPQSGVPAQHASSEPSAPPVAEAVPISRARSARNRGPVTWLALAATALGAAVVPSVLAVQQARQAGRAELQAQAVADLLADPDATVVRAEVAGGGTAVGVLADERALFTATGLAEPGEGREYQLWVLRDGEALPADVMLDRDGTVRALADDFEAGDGLAVTVEPAGGSTVPTTEPVVVLTPTEA